MSRDLGAPERPLEAAAQTLDRLGDRANAAHARYLAIRRLALIGRLDEAERSIAAFDAAPLPPASRAAYLHDRRRRSPSAGCASKPRAPRWARRGRWRRPPASPR